MAENNPELELKVSLEPSPDASPIEEDPETPQENSNGVKTDAEESQKDKPEGKGKEKSSGGRKSSRYHPYKDRHGGSGDKKSSQRNRVFISNIPYDMKWQAIKDLMREKVGEVTYVELFKDAEGKSRGCGVVEFKDEEFVKKAIEVMNKYDLNGRPLNIKEDPDGEHARRVLQRGGGGGGGSYPGGRGHDSGPGQGGLSFKDEEFGEEKYDRGPRSRVRCAGYSRREEEEEEAYSPGRGTTAGRARSTCPPPSLTTPTSPLTSSALCSTAAFAPLLDFKVGWKKLKEVFSMAGVVKRADVKEDKDGKSRGMGISHLPLKAVSF
ncbi:hypothetical protein PHYPO_G00211070 [Pangasianodon hypophthalmus]|uniref:RRM domain-containing protein n=1 Tax=Pangasianodon hypophthalmus TaxID=310915 RepID=A0A5N5P5U2_PANHP|nr:hypothetical protein PHYPO_G00211070 [Pangasianodon hypophthalmus]